MNNSWIGIIMVLVFVGVVTSARGGSLDAPAAPANSASAMWTLKNIYDVLDTRTTNVTKRAGAFTEPGGLPTNGTMYTLNDIMTLVTNRAPVPKTGQTTSYAPYYDDGWFGTNVGVAWPNPRFTTNGAPGTAETNQIRDNLTGLIWARNGNIAGASMPWTNAMEYCRTNLNMVGGQNYNYGGTNDWRLPNRWELESLVNLGQSNPSTWLNTQGFTGAQGSFYWVSTTVANDTSRAWAVHLYEGRVWSNQAKTVAYPVWPVRGGGQ